MGGEFRGVFFYQKARPCNPEAEDVMLQDKFLALLAEVTGTTFPLT